MNRFFFSPDRTHSFNRIRNLRKRCLLRHLMLHCNEGNFIDSWLSCSARGMDEGRDNNRTDVRTIIVQAILAIVSYSKVDIHLEILVDILRCP